MSELRYHPFLGQWVITATHRQDRTFHPPADYCPLCPTKPEGFPTEIPFDNYDIIVFENKFPSLSSAAPHPAVEGNWLMPVRPSAGACEVVCYCQDHNSTFATLELDQVRKLTRVWQDRYRRLGEREDIEYVFIFENKGDVIGVTLSHPHGQIYGYPYVPPIAETELRHEARHHEETGSTIFEDWLKLEASGERLVSENDDFVALVPFFARYPYEVHIVARQSIRSLDDMSFRQLDHLAASLLDVTSRYDRLFGFSLPYIMAMHQKPTIPGFDYTRFHVEFYPPMRTANKLKFLAGSEAGAGAFINDTLPEETAKTLRNL